MSSDRGAKTKQGYRNTIQLAHKKTNTYQQLTILDIASNIIENDKGKVSKHGRRSFVTCCNQRIDARWTCFTKDEKYRLATCSHSGLIHSGFDATGGFSKSLEIIDEQVRVLGETLGCTRFESFKGTDAFLADFRQSSWKNS